MSPAGKCRPFFLLWARGRIWQTSGVIQINKILRGLFILVLTLLPAALKGESLQLTPLTYRVLAEPVQPVLGSDSEYHLVYEISFTNISSQAWKVERIEALNDAGKTLLKLDGAE